MGLILHPLSHSDFDQEFSPFTFKIIISGCILLFCYYFLDLLYFSFVLLLLFVI